MPARPLLLLGHPLLWTPAAPVGSAELTTPEMRDLIADLSATLAEFREKKGFGRAIAAPQIGTSQRVVFMNVGEPRVLVNPEITWRSDEQMELWDDCFSFPELMVRVRRHAEIEIKYEDERGIVQTLRAKNQLAELLQHEIDHVDGVLATDRAIDSRALAMRSEVLRRS